MAEFPEIFRIQQVFDVHEVCDIPVVVRQQLQKLPGLAQVRRGQTVAITAGSRGIANIAGILREIVQFFRDRGSQPFLVPAMGSHGGGTAEGQVQVLARLGIHEATVGCPIRATMDTVTVCTAAEGFPVHFDRYAYEADHVLVCGRIKLHTDFTGPIQSGLMKMLLIGLGKHAGAKVYHRAIHDYNFGQIVRSVAAEVLRHCRILGGIAIVENAEDQTALIEAVPPEDIETRETQLLQLADSWMARIPFDDVDVLVIDQIGKDISGAGMDTNVVGRKFSDHEAVAGETPRVRRIFVRGLSPGTHGNATGIGMAEFALTRLVHEIDRQSTWMNCLTSGHVTAAMIPVHFETDREVLEVALGTIGLRKPSEARLIWVKNTLALKEMECSTAYADQVAQHPRLRVLSPPRALPLNSAGYLPDGGWW